MTANKEEAQAAAAYLLECYARLDEADRALACELAEAMMRTDAAGRKTMAYEVMRFVPSADQALIDKVVATGLADEEARDRFADYLVFEKTAAAEMRSIARRLIHEVEEADRLKASFDRLLSPPSA